MANTQLTLLSILLLLTGFIIYLAIMLLTPAPAAKELTFTDIIEFSNQKISTYSTVDLVYKINITMNDEVINGTMTFTRNGTQALTTLTPELERFSGYSILLSPESLINFIQTNNREEYSGDLTYNDTTCWSTISAPNGTAFKKVIGGDYLFVTCFDKTIGYPAVAYNSEILNDTLVYSQYTLINATLS